MYIEDRATTLLSFPLLYLLILVVNCSMWRECKNIDGKVRRNEEEKSYIYGVKM